MKTLLTKDEQEVFDLLKDVWGAFIKLPKLHEWENDEFMAAIHQAQNIILARPGLRLYEGDEIELWEIK